MTRTEKILESAARLERLCAESVKHCDRAIAILERNPPTVEGELAMVEAAFGEQTNPQGSAATGANS